MSIYAVNGKEPIAAWIPSRDTAGNGTTTLTDLVGSNNGTLTNMDAATDWVADTGAGGVRALDFDGVDDFVALSPIAISVTTSFSISTWIKTATSGMIISDWNLAVTRGWAMDIRGAGFNRVTFGLYSANGDAGYRMTGDTIVTDDNWRHIVATYDGSQSSSGIKIYVDGVLETLTSLLNTAPGTLKNDRLQIAARKSVASFTGRQDDKRFFNQVLDTDDIAYLYKDGFGRGTTIQTRRRRDLGGYGL